MQASNEQPDNLKRRRLTIDEITKLAVSSRDFYLGPSSKPSRKQNLRLSNKSHKLSKQWRTSRTEGLAILYVTQSYEY